MFYGVFRQRLVNRLQYIELDRIKPLTYFQIKNGCLNGSIFKGIKSDSFLTEIYCEGNTVIINISDKDKGEVELYENRFNRYKKVYSSE